MTRPDPVAGPGQILVDLKAASLNYRDLLQAGSVSGIIPLSDGAGVVARGWPWGRRWRQRLEAGRPRRHRLHAGLVDGEFSQEKQDSSLGGGTVDGVLAQRIAVAPTPSCASQTA